MENLARDTRFSLALAVMLLRAVGYEVTENHEHIKASRSHLRKNAAAFNIGDVRRNPVKFCHQKLASNHIAVKTAIYPIKRNDCSIGRLYF